MLQKVGRAAAAIAMMGGFVLVGRQQRRSRREHQREFRDYSISGLGGHGFDARWQGLLGGRH